jgi:hypothetical protein
MSDIDCQINVYLVHGEIDTEAPLSKWPIVRKVANSSHGPTAQLIAGLLADHKATLSDDDESFGIVSPKEMGKIWMSELRKHEKGRCGHPGLQYPHFDSWSQLKFVMAWTIIPRGARVLSNGGHSGPDVVVYP